MLGYNEPGYLQMAQTIMQHGNYRKPDGEEGRREVFDYTLRFDLRNNTLPLLTTKFVPFKSLAVEMLWFISGSQRVDLLHDYGVPIWDTWGDPDTGVVGPLYGYQWRHWHVDPIVSGDYHEEVDQLEEVLKKLRDKPEARSHVVTAWRPDHLPAMAIKPCHMLFQFYRFDGKLSLSLFQRSCDTFLGVPFNIAQYSLLCHMVARYLGDEAYEFIWHGADVHIYENHFEQINTQIEREPGQFPKIYMPRKHPDKYEFADFTLDGYEHQGRLKGDISPQGQPGKGQEI